MNRFANYLKISSFTSSSFLFRLPAVSLLPLFLLVSIQPVHAQTASIPLDELPTAPTSGTLSNGVGFEVNVGQWYAPNPNNMQGYIFYPGTSPQIWDFDVPVSLRFGLRGLNIAGECFRVPDGTVAEFIHPNHTWDPFTRLVCRAANTPNSESIFTIDGPVTQLVLEAINTPSGGRGPGFIEVTLNEEPDVHYQKTVDPVVDEITPGQTFTFTITAENISPDEQPLTGLSFTDNLSNVLDDAVYNNDVSADIGTAGFNDPPGEITWSGDLNFGEVATISYSVTVNDPLTGDGVLTNGIVSPDNGNCTDDPAVDPDCFTVTPLPDISVEKSVVNPPPPDPEPGDVVTYQFVITNQGTAAAAGISVADDLAGVLDDAVYNEDAAASPSVGSVSFNETTQRLFWNGSLAASGDAGDSVMITYSVTINSADDIGDGNLENAIVSAGCPDPPVFDPGDLEYVEGCVTSTAINAPNIELTKTVDPNQLVAGETITYTFRAANTGNVTLTGVTISESAFSGAGTMSALNCTPAQPAALDPQETLECTATYTVQQADVDARQLTNTAQVTGLDPNSNQVTDEDEAEVAALFIDLTGGECWRMLSSPVQDLSYATMLADIWTQGAAGSGYPDGDPNVFTWDIDTQDWTPVSDLNSVIPPGEGFLVSVFADDDFDGTDDPFPKTITIPAGAEHTAPLDDVSMTNLDDGEWALLGNPFQSNIDTQELTANSSNLTGAYYVYDRDIDGYVSTAGGFGDLEDGAIAVGQGFFVQASGAAPTLSFIEASKVDLGRFYGKQQREPVFNNLPDPQNFSAVDGKGGRRNFVRLEVRGEQLTNSMWIRFSENGSQDPVYGDALELQPLSEQYTLFASRKTDGQLVDIAHFSLPAGEFGFPLAMETTRSGTYTMTVTALDLPAGMELYLHDRNTGASIPLDERFEYSFSLDAMAKSTPNESSERIVPCSGRPEQAKAAGRDRFMVITSAGGPGSELPSEVSLAQNYPNPFNPSTVIRYELPAQSQVRLEVFDMAGRRVATLVEGSAQAGVHTVTFDASHLSSGVYLYSLKAEGVSLTRKLTLIK